MTLLLTSCDNDTGSVVNLFKIGKHVKAVDYY